MKMLLQDERALIVEYGKRMSQEKLSPGTSGNLSIYNEEKKLMAITPSGINYMDLRPEDVVITDLEANIVDGSRKPSSEWALHSVFYRDKPEARAVVHSHSMYCTVLAALNLPVKAVHYVIGDAGTAEVPCVPYHTFGTVKLAEESIKYCGKGKAVLLGNHGQIVCGSDLKSAYGLACNLEFLAEVQYKAMCLGNPVILNGEQMKEVMEKFKTYGQTNH
jgi:L-fuculose-phosphate aldolase